MTSTQLMVGIKTMFSMKGIYVNQTWLRQSIANNLNEEDLFGKVYSEYLKSDLKQSGNRSLKPIIERKGVSVDCKEIFAVQIQYLFEVSTLPNIQLRRLRLGTLFWGDNSEGDAETFDDIKTRRFHLILTDGTDTITAIEATSIPDLNTQLAPGSKLLLEGPMRYINNLLYLESRNVKVLGGGVKEMAILNCYENVLLRALDCAETNLPGTYQESGVPRENLAGNKETIELGPLSDCVVINVMKADDACISSVSETNQLFPLFPGFETNSDVSGLNAEVTGPNGGVSETSAGVIGVNTGLNKPNPALTETNVDGVSGPYPKEIKSEFIQALNLSTHIGKDQRKRNVETNSNRISKRLCTRSLATLKLNKNKDHGNGNIDPKKHAHSHSTQSLKLEKPNSEQKVKDDSIPKQNRDGSKSTEEPKQDNKAVISDLKNQSSHLSKDVIDPESHSKQPSNSLTEIDAKETINNELIVTKLITPPPKFNASSSNTNAKPIDQSKSNSRHTANSSDHHRKSFHGSTDKTQQSAIKKKSDENFESLYNEMRKKRNKLYDEKKIVMKENEALRQKVDITEKALVTLNEEIKIRDESLKEANFEKTRLEDELKIVRNREQVLQLQVPLHETERCQLRAQLETQLVATSTVTNLLHQQMDNAKRYLKSTAKDTTVIQEEPTHNISVVNDSIPYLMENTTTSKRPKTPSRPAKKISTTSDYFKQFKCDFCDKRYMRADTRNKHSALYHKEEIEERKKLDSMSQS